MDYSKLKVAELKELLKQRGLSATGSKKQQIIDALEEDDVESGEQAEPEQDDAEEEEVDVKVKSSSRSSTKRKASSPVPASPTKQPKKAKPEPADTPTDTNKPTPKITEAQFAVAGAKLDIPIDEGVASVWHVYVDSDTGIIYDASLNQTNASNNNNKFYRVQVGCIIFPCAH